MWWLFKCKGILKPHYLDCYTWVRSIWYGHGGHGFTDGRWTNTGGGGLEIQGLDNWFTTKSSQGLQLIFIESYFSHCCCLICGEIKYHDLVLPGSSWHNIWNRKSDYLESFMVELMEKCTGSKCSKYYNYNLEITQSLKVTMGNCLTMGNWVFTVWAKLLNNESNSNCFCTKGTANKNCS